MAETIIARLAVAAEADDLATRLLAFNDEACGGGVGVITEAAKEIERLRSIIAQISDVLLTAAKL